MTPETPDQISGGPPPPPGPRTGRRLAVAGVVAAALAVGGVAVAQAATSDAPSASPSASASPGASPGGTAGDPDRGPRRHSPHLAGTVVSASDGTITITDFEGFQRTIHTSAATTYSDGLTATPAAGTRIVAEGTVDSDKTSLKATRIAKAPDRAGPGRGFPGGGPGRGFPGRHHDRDGTPPSGSATPPSPATPGASPTS